MIKFFRHIRKDLMEQNKTGKYFKYAIGEIVLVVIGILIALSINNCNEEKKIKEKERHALIEILSDLDLNISSLNGILNEDGNNVNLNMNSIKIITSNLKNIKTYHDSLAIHFSNIFSYKTVNLKSSGYESLTSIGMDLISDNELQSEIGKFYTYTLPKVKVAHIEMRDDFYHYMLDFLRKEFIEIRDEQNNIKLAPVNYESLQNNREFIGSLRVYLGVNLNFKRKTLETIDETRKLKKLIKDNLKQ